MLMRSMESLMISAVGFSPADLMFSYTVQAFAVFVYEPIWTVYQPVSSPLTYSLSGWAGVLMTSTVTGVIPSS